ncbi:MULTISPECIES: GIY-YIG nuclease family protein [Microbacterium]|uniref:GIY-YIG nuclease family protein n=1 Tax=Microbacterium TaxID=33882 RepID=UPI002892C1CF|nr:GIY-YIG nuclease family protein [Microbacterium sp. A(2022)]
MGYVYILRCSDGTLYVGSTRDLTKRIVQHQEGMGSEYTKRRLPVELIWSSEHARIDDAFAWEKRLQGWSHAKRLAFIDGGLDAVRGWSVRERRERAARGKRPAVR